MPTSLGKPIVMRLNKEEEVYFKMNNFYIPPTKPNEIYHYGIKRRSGRYPYGSGDRPFQDRAASIAKTGIRTVTKGAGKAARKIDRGLTKAAAVSVALRELKDEKNLKIGQERLNNRIKKANSEADKLSRKIGWGNTEKAGKEFKRMENIRDVSESILNDEERTRRLGDHTRKVRNVVVTASTIGSVGSYATSAAWLASYFGSGISISATLGLPVIPAAAIAYKGYKYYKKTTY